MSSEFERHASVHRIIEMITTRHDPDDLVMKVEAGGPIPTESSFPGELKDYCSIKGFSWGMTRGSEQAGWSPAVLYVVRPSDKSSAIYMSHLANHKKDIVVTIKRLRAGGREAAQVLELKIEKARIVDHFMTTGGTVLGGCELVGFSGRKYRAVSSPQQAVGAKGADATFEADIQGAL